jgi:hypothetical protein
LSFYTQPPAPNSFIEIPRASRSDLALPPPADFDCLNAPGIAAANAADRPGGIGISPSTIDGKPHPEFVDDDQRGCGLSGSRPWHFLSKLSSSSPVRLRCCAVSAARRCRRLPPIAAPPCFPRSRSLRPVTANRRAGRRSPWRRRYTVKHPPRHRRPRRRWLQARTRSSTRRATTSSRPPVPAHTS